jgi:tRNA-dihydrouridine synthase
MAWYLHGVRGAAAARDEVMQTETLDEVRAIFEKIERAQDTDAANV